MSTEPSDSITTLTAGNYHSGYAELSYLLREKGYWSIVQETITLPDNKAWEGQMAKEKALG